MTDTSRRTASDPERTLPQNLEAEAAVLGAMMLSGEALANAVKCLHPDDFYRSAHRTIYAAIRGIYAHGDPVDVITVADELKRRGDLKSVGGPLAVNDLTDQVPTTAGAVHYARMVTESARDRRRIATAQAIVEAGFEGKPTADLVAALQANSAAASDQRLTVTGAEFILDSEADDTPIWGRDDAVLMSPGEPTLICGPTGVGKTTLAQLFIAGRIGVRDELLGLPVVDAGRVLYIAADRPRQAQRAAARIFGDTHRDLLAERLVVHRGPLPIEEVPRLAEGFGTVIVDSLKDVAVELGRDETGSRVAKSFSDIIATGAELIVLHHQRKAQADNKRPRSIADVYGSAWITAAAGSVLLLWGNPGDAVVELIHLKQPSAPVGPLKIRIDHERGRLEIIDRPDMLGLLRASGSGVTAKAAARQVFESDGAATTEKARRQLERLAGDGLAIRKPGPSGSAMTYFAAALSSLEEHPA